MVLRWFGSPWKDLCRDTRQGWSSSSAAGFLFIWPCRGGCPMPGIVQGWIGLGFKKLCLEDGIPALSKGFGTKLPLRHFKVWFYDPVVSVGVGGMEINEADSNTLLMCSLGEWFPAVTPCVTLFYWVLTPHVLHAQVIISSRGNRKVLMSPLGLWLCHQRWASCGLNNTSEEL